MQHVPIGQIKANPRNPRVIKDDKFAKLKASIESFPQMLEKRPLVCFTDTDGKYVVLGGNMRLRAAQELKIKTLPVLLADDWTEEQKAEFLIKDNVGFGEWNWDDLANEWDAEKLEEWGLDIPAYATEEVLEAEEDDFEVELPTQPITVLGDLYEIGEHRLLCGDSTDSDLLEKLLQNKKPDLLLTDPPYGINADRQHFEGHGWTLREKTEWDKSKPESGVLQYLCQITENQIIWGGNYFTDDLPPSMGWLIWDKGQRGFSLADGEMAWTSFNNALRIKEYARAKANKEEKNHPTQKPQEIMQWCFEYADRHSKIEIKLVLDAYLGSGTTMVASHQLKRKCYGMELDPKYCDVIVKRMHKLDPALVIKRNGTITNDFD
jgi:DNA modification methylase